MLGALGGWESVDSLGTRTTDVCEPLFVCWRSNGFVGRNSQCLPTELSLQLCLGTFTPVQTLGSGCTGPAARLEDWLIPEESKTRMLSLCVTHTDSVLPKSVAGFRPGQGAEGLL